MKKYPESLRPVSHHSNTKIHKFVEVKNSHPDLIKVTEQNGIKIMSECAAPLHNSTLTIRLSTIPKEKKPKSLSTKK